MKKSKLFFVVASFLVAFVGIAATNVSKDDLFPIYYKDNMNICWDVLVSAYPCDPVEDGVQCMYPVSSNNYPAYLDRNSSSQCVDPILYEIP